MNLKDVIAAVAPTAETLLTAVGGPVGPFLGAAVGILSHVFKVAPTGLPEAITNDPAAAAKLAEAEITLKQLDLQGAQQQIEAKQQTRSWLNDTFSKRILLGTLAYFIILFSVILLLCLWTNVNLTAQEMTLISLVGAPVVSIVTEIANLLKNQ